MNLNKYHSTGRLYTKDEADHRDAKLLRPTTYLAYGYMRKGEPEALIKPYANEAKRQARDTASRMRTSPRRGQS